MRLPETTCVKMIVLLRPLGFTDIPTKNKIIKYYQAVKLKLRFLLELLESFKMYCCYFAVKYKNNAIIQ